jgi:hypothetical protein
MATVVQENAPKSPASKPAKEVSFEAELIDFLEKYKIDLGAKSTDILVQLHTRARTPSDALNTNTINRYDIINMRELLKGSSYLPAEVCKTFIKHLCLQYIENTPHVELDKLAITLLQVAGAKLKMDPTSRVAPVIPLVTLIASHSPNINFELLAEIIQIADLRSNELAQYKPQEFFYAAYVPRKGTSIDYSTLGSLSSTSEGKACKLVEAMGGNPYLESKPAVQHLTMIDLMKLPPDEFSAVIKRVQAGGNPFERKIVKSADSKPEPKTLNMPVIISNILKSFHIESAHVVIDGADNTYCGKAWTVYYTAPMIPFLHSEKN